MPTYTEKMVIGFGGYIQFSVPGQTMLTRREVTRWKRTEKYILKEITHSGCGGQIARKVVATDWSGRFEIPYLDNIDLHNDLKTGSEFVVTFTQNDGATYDGLAIVENFDIVSDSSGTDVVQIAIDLIGAGVLPESDGGPNTLLEVDLTNDPLVFTP